MENALYTFIPLCWAELVGILTPFHIQESKGQVVQQRQKKVPPFHPSPLRNRPFSLSNLMANFHYIPLLSQTVVIPKAQLGMWRNKERSNSFFRKPSVESPNPPSHPTQTPQAHPRLWRWVDNTVIPNNYIQSVKSNSSYTQGKPKADTWEMGCRIKKNHKNIRLQ